MPAQDRDLQDLRALVIGGTKGIGHAVAARLRESGARVLVTARTVVSDVPDADFVAADVATRDGCAKVVDAVGDRYPSRDRRTRAEAVVLLTGSAIRSAAAINRAGRSSCPSDADESGNCVAVPTIVPETRQNSVFRANASQLARSGK
jgi:NAD(P)-dependent dehydrogenase (short-subunit alcohol dehydrogenase family)